MNRNTELHFGTTPKIEQRRSKFDLSHSVKLTANTGDCFIPYVDADILPGDTVQMDMAEIVRMATPIYPVMDNAYMDIYWFFVPHRLVWEHWQAFWGENDDPWTQTTEYEIPQIEAPTGGWTEGTIADYMGIPTKVSGISVNALPFRAYCKIWNDWFRDENLKSCCHIYQDETTRTGKNGTEVGYDYVTGAELGGAPLKIAKLHGLFTSCLPAPQKSDPVKIPMGTTAWVKTAGYYSVNNGQNYKTGDNFQPLMFVTDYASTTAGVVDNTPMIQTVSKGLGIKSNVYGFLTEDASTADNPQFTPGTGASGSAPQIAPANLYADLTQATAVTINQLRTAFAIQKYYENAGLHGTRYIEYLKGVFGVTSSDARLQRAEYLGGRRVPIGMDQILQTSSTDATSPQGNTSGFSCTKDSGSVFTKSFEEHGTLMCICAIRTDRTYQQGLSKMWTRKKWTDFYNPFFANLGEQAVLNENIYAQGTNTDKQAFGYQEAWADYRYKENRTCGYMRSNATGSLDVWHYADDYNALPQLSGTWIDEPKENVDRVIAVSSALTHQFIGDFFFKTAYTRCMPVYSIPGLIDHV